MKKLPMFLLALTSFSLLSCVREDADRAAKADKEVPEMISIPGKHYEIGKYEVTQAEWLAVMGSNPSEFKHCGKTCPVEKVSWNDVQEYLRKLNRTTGRHYRLPTEIEWSYACLGGARSEYCGGNNIGSVAWYSGNSDNAPHPAGQMSANGYGLYDMSGNVWEWMNDCYDKSCAERALRGGSWKASGAYVLRATFRGIDVPDGKYGDVGFRLARTLP
ncbi:MAG: formylglycine-generating enzyme family protein [Gallionella sp.]|nr:formylglycine-generating enzyme family protein [Gallionella sp.]